ncbi:MAG: hypothetical protein WCG27_04920 [Pseudomonadota bacterium]
MIWRPSFIFCSALLSFTAILYSVAAVSGIRELTSTKSSTQSVQSAQVASAAPPTGSTLKDYSHRHSFGLGYGQTYIRGGFDQLGKDGMSPDLYYSYRISPLFDFVANFHRATFQSGKANEQEVTLAGLTLGPKHQFYQFDSFSAFVMGGLGFYQPTTSQKQNGEVIESDGHTVLGLHLGTGVQLNLNENYAASFIGHYHDPFDVELDNGGKLSGSYLKIIILGSYIF